MGGINYKILELKRLMKRVSDLHGGGDTPEELRLDMDFTLKKMSVDEAIKQFKKLILENEWRGTKII